MDHMDYAIIAIPLGRSIIQDFENSNYSPYAEMSKHISRTKLLSFLNFLFNTENSHMVANCYHEYSTHNTTQQRQAKWSVVWVNQKDLPHKCRIQL